MHNRSDFRIIVSKPRLLRRCAGAVHYALDAGLMCGCQDLVASGAMELVWVIAARGRAHCERQVGCADVDSRLNRKVVSLLPIAEVLGQPNRQICQS